MNRRTCLVALALAIVFVLVNAVAFMQARAMTRFTTGGPRTAPPEALGPLEAAGVLLTGVRIPRPTVEWTRDVGGFLAMVPANRLSE